MELNMVTAQRIMKGFILCIKKAAPRALAQR